jgi:hypothetical protein
MDLVDYRLFLNMKVIAPLRPSWKARFGDALIRAEVGHVAAH